MTINYLENDYRSFIHVSRYARWIEEEGRRETWEETIDRYINFAVIPTLGFDGADVAHEIREAILKCEVLPSMRSLMTAGPAAERDNTCMYNPVAGDTLVITRDGHQKIEDLEGQHLEVVNKDGKWAWAEFHGYGEQDTFGVVLSPSGGKRRETVYATANHRWLKTDGQVVPTSGLNIGDRIPFATAPRPEVDEDYILGVRHGIIYGDGTSTKTCKRVNGYMIRLCGDSSDLMPYFEGYPVSYPPTCNGEPVVYLYDGFAATHQLKELPRFGETDSYLLGFVRGWLATDGHVGKDNGAVSISACSAGTAWLSAVAPRIGMVVQNTYEQPRVTNYGERNFRIWTTTLDRASMLVEDFLLPRRAEAFKPLDRHFVVKEIVNGPKQRVYCAEVPDTNTFTLAGGIVTGNCSYLPVDDPKSFDEAMFILLCGTGVGFSVERQYIAKLPEVPETMFKSETTIVVKDSKEGWAKALRQLIALLYSGEIPKWDVSKVRPAGARLKTFGGRASGPAPLVDLFNYVTNIFVGAKGRRLNSLECHDIMCKIGEVVVVGGVRRSAMISLSNLSDDRLRHAKSGNWWENNKQRALSNNSVAYTEKPDMETFLREWTSLVESKSGERGIFNREASKKQAKKNGRRDANYEFGTNP